MTGTAIVQALVLHGAKDLRLVKIPRSNLHLMELTNLWPTGDETAASSACRRSPDSRQSYRYMRFRFTLLQPRSQWEFCHSGTACSRPRSSRYHHCSPRSLEWYRSERRITGSKSRRQSGHGGRLSLSLMQSMQYWQIQPLPNALIQIFRQNVSARRWNSPNHHIATSQHVP
jgi:hypothetical protein